MHLSCWPDNIVIIVSVWLLGSGQPGHKGPVSIYTKLSASSGFLCIVLPDGTHPFPINHLHFHPACLVTINSPGPKSHVRILTVSGFTSLVHITHTYVPFFMHFRSYLPPHTHIVRSLRARLWLSWSLLHMQYLYIVESQWIIGS